MVDAGDSKSPDGNIVRVRVSPRAPKTAETVKCRLFAAQSAVKIARFLLAKRRVTWPEGAMMRIWIVILAFLAARPLVAGEVTIAVASNFLPTAEALAEEFEAASGHDVTIVHGATGQIYAQIINGAPYDIFLAADQRRPELLAEVEIASERRTYAIGKLTLVASLDVGEDISESVQGRTVALADPTVAPYGLAATAAMERLGLDTATFKPVLVANVGQVATVFATGNAEFAFLSTSQLDLVDAAYVLDLDGLHPPVVQDAALLTRASGNEAADAFWAYLFSDEAAALVSEAGYDLPE